LSSAYVHVNGHTIGGVADVALRTLNSKMTTTIGVSYPKCIGGERACPPEDCGGIPGYYSLLDVLQDPTHPDYEENITWLKEHAKNYYPYEADKFSPEQVRFDNPQKRWRLAFSQ